jgi:tRNA(His) 5'-end guanylyltransferase
MKNLAEFDYLKTLEDSVETYIPADQYMVARLDGHGFHNFTKGLTRPFDATLRETMADVTKLLMERFGATESYTQSDEITLIWHPRQNRNGTGWVEHPHSGRVVKLATLMASYCSTEFYKLIQGYKVTNYNGFDCRVYGGPENVATDSKRFRFIDCATNAYQQVAQSLWSQKQLNGVSVQQIKAMLKERDINVWHAYGDDAMLGVYFYKEEIVVPSSREYELFGHVAKIINRTGRYRIVRSNGAEMMKRIKEN